MQQEQSLVQQDTKAQLSDSFCKGMMVFGLMTAFLGYQIPEMVMAGAGAALVGFLIAESREALSNHDENGWAKN